MKINYNYIKAILVIGVVIFLFGFAEKRNNTRKVESFEVEFNDLEDLYVTEEAVNKLLIQNKVAVTSVGKETLDLNRVEAVLNKHEHIENAEVFVTLNGVLKTNITQRKPIGRILENGNFYVDRFGEKMALSQFYSARVPVVTGVGQEMLKEVFPILDYISKDDFLTRHITAVKRKSGGVYELEVRQMDFSLFFGEVDNINQKFNNFKAFYKKAHKDQLLNTYNVVDLQFGNQVVCTKK